MLWVYGHKKYFNSFSVGTDFIHVRQNLILTYNDGPCTGRVKGFRSPCPKYFCLGSSQTLVSPVNPLPTKLSYFNSHPIKMGEYLYMYMYNLNRNI